MKQRFCRWLAGWSGKRATARQQSVPAMARDACCSPTAGCAPAPYPGVENPSPGQALWTPAQAQAFFQWHMAHLPERIRVLAEYAAAEGSHFVPDGTPESLETLWAWMEGHIHLRERTDEEMTRKVKDAPDWFKPIAAEHTRTLSDHTLDLLWDCAAYFAHVMLQEHPGLSWQVCQRRRDISFQMPVISGFAHKIELNPAQIVTNMAWRSAAESDPGQLLQVYRVWEGYLK